MDYQQAAGRLSGRCYNSRKIGNHTYLKRRSSNEIAVQLHATDILNFHSDGSIEVNTGGWETVTTRARINEFLPGDWRVHSERRATILSNHRWREVNGEYVRMGSVEVLLDNHATILPNGEVEGGGDVEGYRQRIREADTQTKRLRNRARYWIRKARNGEPSKNLTVENIIAEENVSVRLAKMKVFGFDRFFVDGKAKLEHAQAGYELLEIPINQWDSVKALKMICPSTGGVYVNAVPPSVHDVPSALDWMFATRDYLAQVTQQA